jgi:hypothetical protein
MRMLLPLPQRWPIRCARCGHNGEISAALTDLATKVLACRACGHGQPDEPAAVGRSSRAANGRRARACPAQRLRAASPTPELKDGLADLWAAG